MHRKRQSKKKRPIRESLSSSEEAVVSSVLQDFQDKDPSEILSRISEPRLAQSFVERLPLNYETPISLLSAFNNAFADKNTRKAVNRAIFKLKSKGIPVEEFYSQKGNAPAILQNPKENKADAYIGPYIFRKGTRPVFIILNRTGGGQDLGVGLVSDEDGFSEFLYDSYSKKSIREIKKDLTRKSGVLIETSLSHVATIFEEAYRRHLDLNSAPPVGYLELRPWLLENASLLDRPVIYDFISGSGAYDDLLTHSMLIKLFEHKLMLSWLIDPEPLRPYIEDILKVDESPLILSGSQKIERISRLSG